MKDTTAQSLRAALEIPLLISLIELGGSSASTNEALLRLVSDKTQHNEMTDKFDPVHNKPRWIYELQWTRRNLVLYGEIDGSKRGIWKITEKGRERVQFAQEGKPYTRRPNPMVSPAEEQAFDLEMTEAPEENFAAEISI